MIKDRCKKLIVIFSVILLGLVLFGSVEGHVERYRKEYRETLLVVVAEVEDEIKAGTAQFFKRVISQAEEIKADYLVIKLDTPGGLLKATEDIVDLILETEITTIIFVHQEGGWAYSAGTFILMAADYAIVHPEASIGAAQPVVMGAGQEVAEKMTGAMASWMRSLAEIHQRDPEIAEKFIRENLTLTGREAKKIGIIDGTARDLEEVFLKLNILEPDVRIIQLTLFEKFFNFLSHPHLISLFLTIGGLAIIMAVRSGEFEITGIVGIITLLIGFWGMGIITFSFLGIGLLLAGLFLLMMEIFVEPGFGIFGIGGAIAVVLGIFTFGAEPFFVPGFFDAMTMLVIGAGLALCLFFVIMTRGVAKTIKSKPKTGPEALIGLNVEVIKKLDPRGYVKVNQETWSAKSVDEEIILEKSKVEIIKVEGNTLIVKSLNS